MTKVQVTKDEHDYLKTFGRKKNKAIFYLSRFGWYHLLEDGNDKTYNDKGKKWSEILGNGDFENVRHKLIRAVLDGCELIKEPLYTVEIPNPKRIGKDVHVLMKNGFNNVVLVSKVGDDWKKQKGYQLTEEEIKKDFAWAWEWAKTVEEE